MKKVTFKSLDGLKLVGIWNIPKEKNSNVIILAHGLTVDKNEDGFFIDLAKVLQQNNFSVFRFDFRGSGESGGKSTDLTIAGEILDLSAAISEVQKKRYKNIGLVGASFGGAIASFYSVENQDKIKALCLLNPCLNLNNVFINPILSWLKNDMPQIKNDFKNKGWSEIGSSRFIVGKQLFEEMEHTYPYKALNKINIPSIIVHGTADDTVPYEDSKKYIKNLKKGKFISIKNAKHGFHDNKSKILVIKEILKFFKKYL